MSDCDDDEMLKKSRHERRRRKISDSDTENDDNITEVIEKNASSANKKLSKKLPTNMSLIVQSSSGKVENTGTNGIYLFLNEYLFLMKFTVFYL